MAVKQHPKTIRVRIRQTAIRRDVIRIRTFRPDSSSPPGGHMDHPAWITVPRVCALTREIECLRGSSGPIAGR